METVRTISYDEKTTGRKVIAFPPEMPFRDHLNELLTLAPTGEKRDELVKISAIENIFKRVDAICDYLNTSSEPSMEILRMAALAAEGDTAGLKLIFSALLTLPPLETMVMESVGFKNVKRVMARIVRKEKAGKELRESEDWFKKKIVLLSISHPLPGTSNVSAETPWIGWEEGVRRAVADPDRRWNQAIMGRAKAELEALDLRAKLALARISFLSKERSTNFLITEADETKWRLQALEGAYQRYGEATLIVRQKLGDKWDPMIEALRKRPAGSALADLFDTQLAKAHSYPHIRTGTSVVRALLMHPLLLRVQRAPDYLSCVAIYVNFAGRGIIEVLLHKLAAVNILKVLLELPGFDLQHKILTIDLKMVPPVPFIDVDEMPRDIDWTNIQKESKISYKTLVSTYIDNDNFICELLNNPRVLGQPGIMSLIALRCRSIRVLTILANRRDLHTGFANKDVPLNLLMNPAKISVSSLRKFIHVRFIDKATLARLGGKGSQLREEVRREIQRYLSSLN